MVVAAKDTQDGSSRLPLKMLQANDILTIDQALERVGRFGEVHLVVEHGRIRFIRIVQSEAVTGTPEEKRKTRAITDIS